MLSKSPAALVNPDLSALAAVIFNGRSMHICVYNDATVSMSITHKLMTRPTLVNMYGAMQPETSRKVGKTIMNRIYRINPYTDVVEQWLRQT